MFSDVTCTFHDAEQIDVTIESGIFIVRVEHVDADGGGASLLGTTAVNGVHLTSRKQTTLLSHTK